MPREIPNPSFSEYKVALFGSIQAGLRGAIKYLIPRARQYSTRSLPGSAPRIFDREVCSGICQRAHQSFYSWSKNVLRTLGQGLGIEKSKIFCLPMLRAFRFAPSSSQGFIKARNGFVRSVSFVRACDERKCWCCWHGRFHHWQLLKLLLKIIDNCFVRDNYFFFRLILED